MLCFLLLKLSKGLQFYLEALNFSFVKDIVLINTLFQQPSNLIPCVLTLALQYTFFRTTFTVNTHGENAIQRMLMSHSLTNGITISNYQLPHSA